MSFLDVRDRVTRLNALYRVSSLSGADKSRVRQLQQELEYVGTPEPDEELEDSELSDVERRAAMTRERMRREGII